MGVVTSSVTRVIPSTVGSTAFHGRRKWHDLLIPLLAGVPDVDCLPRGVVGQAPLAKESLRPQLMHRPQSFLNRRVVVGGVEVEEVHRRHADARGERIGSKKAVARAKLNAPAAGGINRACVL